eukprot:764796-Hanusia_phi.AAC.1
MVAKEQVDVGDGKGRRKGEEKFSEERTSVRGGNRGNGNASWEGGEGEGGWKRRKGKERPDGREQEEVTPWTDGGSTCYAAQHRVHDETGKEHARGDQERKFPGVCHRLLQQMGEEEVCAGDPTATDMFVLVLVLVLVLLPCPFSILKATGPAGARMRLLRWGSSFHRWTIPQLQSEGR